MRRTNSPGSIGPQSSVLEIAEAFLLVCEAPHTICKYPALALLKKISSKRGRATAYSFHGTQSHLLSLSCPRGNLNSPNCIAEWGRSRAVSTTTKEGVAGCIRRETQASEENTRLLEAVHILAPSVETLAQAASLIGFRRRGVGSGAMSTVCRAQVFSLILPKLAHR